METYADLLRDVAERLDRDFAKNAGDVREDVRRVLDGMTNAMLDGEGSHRLPHMLVSIENHPKRGVSAKFEMPALMGLSAVEFERFVNVTCGIISQVAAERTAG